MAFTMSLLLPVSQIGKAGSVVKTVKALLTSYKSTHPYSRFLSLPWG